MARATVSNAVGFINGLDRSIARFEKKWTARNKVLVDTAMRKLIARTPVYTGQTIRNYVASNGSPASGGVKAGEAPVERTNRLSIGTEKLRGGAEAQALATLASVDFSDPYDTFFIVNKSPAVAGLEVGALPAEPFTPRSPAGMFGITLQELAAIVDQGMLT
jgi:hypothetical protein